ncbi:eukaryotic translation initiation factor 3 subunit M [Argonauta hians]
MSIPVFIDLTVPEQTIELRVYLKSVGADIKEENGADLRQDLKDIVTASPVCFKEPSDSDVEMFFNGVISLIMLVPETEVEDIVSLFCDIISKAPPGDKRGHLRLRLLTNVFSGLDEGSYLRYTVYYSMLRLAKQADLLQMVPTDLTKVKSWMAMWKLPVAKNQILLRMLHDAVFDAKMSDTATQVMIELLGTYTEDNASQAREDAHRCIVTCLADPGTFLMDHLLTLKPVKFLEGELIHDLLTIFVTEKLAKYKTFYAKNTDFINAIGLSHDNNIRKMRLLTFMQMCENRREIDFYQIQQELQLEADKVEDFVIDVLKTKAVRAKMDQMQKKVLVNSTIHRTFSRAHWQMLRQYLLQWQLNLQEVGNNLQSLSAEQKM